MRAKPMILASLLAAVYVAFLVWFQGTNNPLTNEEIETTLAKVKANTESHGRKSDPHLADEIRTLMSTDDGKSFYMVNLIRYNEKAVYPPGLNFSDDPQEADARYIKLLLPYLLKNGNLPVFAGKVEGSFLQPQDADEWDVVGIVRYRSRRDLLNMILGVSADPVDIGVHKWASIKKTQVFPVAPKFDFIAVRGLVAAGLIVLGLLLHALLRLVPAYRR